MDEFPLDPKIAEIWKLMPLRLSGRSNSKCCGEETLLVQSMQGGFVTRNCSRCGERFNLPERTFMELLDLWVACPDCRQRMVTEILPDLNYGYVCGKCDKMIKLASLLPRWEDL